ncbi:TPA: hypothetical protein UMY79_004363 [Stenotrophomonas maltophilia]|nr:hypothetical protein [Stenotrophomonas maltophilia]HEL3817429.1 hypothetical protein [Stenotrophomonas maltophilia]
MNQGRTDRDWAIVSVLTFIAGVVVTGLITDSDGLSRWISDVEWPAWTQAAVALAVGYAAVEVPRKIADAERSRRTDLLVTLLGNALFPAEALAKMLSTRNVDMNFANGLARDIELQLKTLDSYPAADVPSAPLLLKKVETQSHCLGLLELFRKASQKIEAMRVITENQAAAFEVYRAAIRQLIDEVPVARS